MPMHVPVLIRWLKAKRVWCCWQIHQRGNCAHLQMTMRQPAAVAMRAAVNLVAMPPVPHCVPLVLVSTWGEQAETEGGAGESQLLQLCHASFE